MIESQKTIIDESMENLEISKMAPQSKRMNKYQNVNSMEEPVVFDTQNGTTYGINDPMTFYDELSYFPMNDNEHMENINMFTPMTFEENKTNTIIMNQPVEPQNNVTNEPKPKTTKRKNVKKKTTTYQVPNENLVAQLSTSQLPPQTGLGLRIQKQPPAQTVYQRILKPYPVIMLLAPPNFSEQSHNLFVECQLLGDKNVNLSNCLEGSTTVRIAPGVFATFRKLKILSTSQQKKTHFRLRFHLKRYVGNNFEPIQSPSVYSNTIEVFSHTYYLSSRKNKTAPPKINEILPFSGPSTGGTRVALIGSNFVNSSNLTVKFGDLIVSPEYHETGTLIFTTPPASPGTKISVSVSNDGKEFSQSDTSFTYT